MGNANSNEEAKNDPESPTGHRDDHVLGLSAVEIRQIRQLWTQARRKGPDEPGKSILMAIFMKNPEIERMFRFTEVDGAQTKSEQFAAHAQRFTRALDNVINHLHDKKKANETLAVLGKFKRFTKNFNSLKDM